MAHSFDMALVVALAVSAAGCRGKVLATAELHGPGAADAHFKSTGGPVVLWADTDGRWRGPSSSHHAIFPATYEIDITSDGPALPHLSCQTQSSGESVCGTLVSDGNMHHGDCELKLTCTVPTLPAGDVVFHVSGMPGREVLETRKMSLNIREK